MIVEITRQLAEACGPLVVMEDIDFAPIVVTPDREIGAALDEWRAALSRWPWPHRGR